MEGAATPSELGTAYLDAFLARDWPRVRTLVEPQSRYVVDNLALAMSRSTGSPNPTGLTPGSGRVDLTVGSEHMRDDKATITFVGRLCPPSGATAACITNSDPHASDPQFTISAVRLQGRWYVAYPRPSGGSSSAAPNASSIGSATLAPQPDSATASPHTTPQG